MSLKLIGKALLIIAVFVTGIIAGSLVSVRSDQTAIRGVSLNDLRTMIMAGEIEQVTFGESRIEALPAKCGSVSANAPTEADADSIRRSVAQFNNANPGSAISVTDGPKSIRWGWILIIQFLPLIMLVVAFVVLIVFGVWAVRTISGNKG